MKTPQKMQGGIPPARQITYGAQKVKPTATAPNPYTGSRSAAANKLLQGGKK